MLQLPINIFNVLQALDQVHTLLNKHQIQAPPLQILLWVLLFVIFIQNKSKVFQLIDLLLNHMSERAVKHTKQGNKRKYDVVSEKLFVEYKQIQTKYNNYEPQKKAI